MDFDAAYAGSPPWDIGRPQQAFLDLAVAGALTGPLLDAGCGTGEHVLMAAGLGLDATGVDLAPTAIDIAERKASERGIMATFWVADALRLRAFGQEFATVIDCGLFHVFDDGDRDRFVGSLRSVTTTGAAYYMLCFSDEQPGDWGPRRVSEEEIRASFADGWTVESIVPTTLEITISPEGAKAWMASIRRL